MTVNEFAQAVHENAVAHGWYDTAPSFPEIAVMVHAEISEAVEEWREGNPLVYGTCALAAEGCKFSGVCDRVGEPGGDGVDGPCRPEGVAVELCDAIMRIFDYLAYMGVDIEAVLEAKYAYNTGRPYRHGGKKTVKAAEPARGGRKLINYFDAAENTLRGRGYLDSALKNLERRKERIIAHGGPSGYPSPDFSKPYASTSAINDTLAECLELAEVVREIKATEEKIREIDAVISQLGEAERDIIRLWYVEGKSKDEIAAAVNYASTRSIYDLRNTAVAEFALRYFGAVALPSV